MYYTIEIPVWLMSYVCLIIGFFFGVIWHKFLPKKGNKPIIYDSKQFCENKPIPSPPKPDYNPNK